MAVDDSSRRKRLLIVGNGMVAGRFIDELIKRGPEAYEVTVFGDEPEGSYNRILLSSVVAGDTGSASIIQKNAQWYQANNIAFISQRVEAVERKQRCIRTADGQTYDYDHLILATGSRSATIPAQVQTDESGLKGVFPFRTLRHTRQMIERARQARDVVVVGGGLLGLEAAYGLAKRGAKVSLVHRSSWLLNRQLDRQAGAMLQQVMMKLGIRFYLQNEVAAFEAGQGELSAVTLKDGTKMNAQMAVVATGVTPNAELGRDCGLACHRAIVVDDYMATIDPAISAIGECVEHDGKTFGLVDPLWRHAQTLADRLVLGKRTPFTDAPIATKLKVSGVNVYSAGKVVADKTDREIILCDASAHVYRKIILNNGAIVGVVLFGDVNSGNCYFDWMLAHQKIDHLLPNLVVGDSFIHTDKLSKTGGQ